MIFRVIEMSVCPGLTSIWKEEDMAYGEGAEDQVVPLPSISYWPVIYSIGTLLGYSIKAIYIYIFSVIQV